MKLKRIQETVKKFYHDKALMSKAVISDYQQAK
jgi:hypothetical protein